MRIPARPAARSLAYAALAGLLVVGAAPALASGAGGAARRGPRPVALGPNLVVNPSFEQSVIDNPANPVAAMQPLLPVGWTFEGASLLFDYNTRGGHTGPRQVAVSGALAPGTQACDASVDASYRCVPNPAYAATGPVDDAALGVASVRPFWVSQNAIPVVAGKTYRFGAWMIRPSLVPDAGVVGEGAETKVRWIGANGLSVGVAEGPTSVKGAHRQLGWQFGLADLVAPAGAVGAKLLLGHTDYLVTSAQVAFDDVSFQQRLR